MPACQRGQAGARDPSQRVSDFPQRKGEAGSHSHWPLRPYRRDAAAGALKEAWGACQGHPSGD